MKTVSRGPRRRARDAAAHRYTKTPYEVCYDREVDGDNYKLKNKDSTGHYIVELAINPHDGNFLKFTCKDSKDQLYADC